jgi:hypothetical protein
MTAPVAFYSRPVIVRGEQCAHVWARLREALSNGCTRPPGSDENPTRPTFALVIRDGVEVRDLNPWLPPCA